MKVCDSTGAGASGRKLIDLSDNQDEIVNSQGMCNELSLASSCSISRMQLPGGCQQSAQQASVLTRDYGLV